jgi:3-ketosteroid 9alpha-monooxygenase subunit B
VTGAIPVRHRYHPLAVRGVRRETVDAVSIAFDVPAELEETYRYRAGQFVTLRVSIGGAEHFRSYSMSSAPGLDPHLEVTVKRVPAGLVSNWLHDTVRAGTVLEVSRPAGAFVLEGRDHDVAAFAAGSGITPVFSILKSALGGRVRRFSLLYANRDRDASIFADALDELATRHTGRLALVHHLDVERGFVNCGTVAAQVRPDQAVFVCGPAPFVATVEAAAAASGVPADRIHVERFTPAEGAPSGPVDDITVVITLGRQTETVQHRANTTILQAARSVGLRAPSSCEAGTCATCMARLVEGAAQMRDNEALTPDEIADGWILTCQAVPVTPVVKVVYG